MSRDYIRRFDRLEESIQNNYSEWSSAKTNKKRERLAEKIEADYFSYLGFAHARRIKTNENPQFKKLFEIYKEVRDL